MSTKPEPRDYLEVTLHMQGGGQVVFAAESYTAKRNTAGQGYVGLEWKSTEWDDLPKLSGVDLPRLTAITSRQVKETA